jgi:hypothetical protein
MDLQNKRAKVEFLLEQNVPYREIARQVNCTLRYVNHVALQWRIRFGQPTDKQRFDALNERMRSLEFLVADLANLVNRRIASVDLAQGKRQDSAGTALPVRPASS